ncbi:MAG TPA: hypothetical protein VER03_19400 [Bryobacteraceae bacterium]|nr:hypothetical protein [Bryobacteraceae bacterium]
MKIKNVVLVAVSIAFLAALSGFGQVSNPPAKWLYGYVGSQGKWFTIGPTLAVSSSGQIDAVVTQGPVGPQGAQGIAGPIGPQGPAGLPAPKRRKAMLTYDAVAKVWVLPATSDLSTVEISVNGIEYWAGLDYTIVAGKVAAIGTNMLPEHRVTAEYDQ